MTTKIVRRKEEKLRLKQILNSKEAEFVAVCGRRRVGKTCLIRDAIATKKAASIEVTGLKDGDYHRQLTIFAEAFAEAFSLKHTSDHLRKR